MKEMVIMLLLIGIFLNPLLIESKFPQNIKKNGYLNFENTEFLKKKYLSFSEDLDPIKIYET
ncbi:hypothetical protein DID80_04470 [Candidatus Marinamargulisbacteria bacterium SCGC AAA071-K20]|nr:hypothetical protein DID80_04470 [Candidatus Marinamargulisbacteria bacterium SCGC AAA071-K20]